MIMLNIGLLISDLLGAEENIALRITTTIPLLDVHDRHSDCGAMVYDLGIARRASNSVYWGTQDLDA